jgi:hypothetical protein
MNSTVVTNKEQLFWVQVVTLGRAIWAQVQAVGPKELANEAKSSDSTTLIGWVESTDNTPGGVLFEKVVRDSHRLVRLHMTDYPEYLALMGNLTSYTMETIQKAQRDLRNNNPQIFLK